MKKNNYNLGIIWAVLFCYVLLGLFSCVKISEENQFRKDAASILEHPVLVKDQISE